jgi:HD-GYP domain-containing protein (c-di-GMP phosphodiesterase class II)
MRVQQKIRWVQLNLLIQASHQIDRQIANDGLNYRDQHSQRVARWAVQTAHGLGYAPNQTRQVYWAALLHDIGKLGIPVPVLQKAGPLDHEEWALMRMHPTIGANLVCSVHDLEILAPLIYTHQEKFDGSGYPCELKGQAIPLGGRILAVADAYDAMTSDRVYRQALGPSQALAEIQRDAGIHFDPQVVDVFAKLVEAKKGQRSQ